MITKVFVVHDVKAEAYLHPFLAPSKGLAMRRFADTVNDSSSQFNAHPEDFTLYEIGEYDDSVGLYTCHGSKIPLASAVEFRKEPATVSRIGA